MTDREIFAALLAGNVIRSWHANNPAAWAEIKLGDDGLLLGRGCTAGAWTTQYVISTSWMETRSHWEHAILSQTLDDAAEVDALMGERARKKGAE